MSPTPYFRLAAALKEPSPCMCPVALRQDLASGQAEAPQSAHYGYSIVLLVCCCASNVTNRTSAIAKQSSPETISQGSGVQACNLVLDTVQQLWEPLEGRVKDYVATPKPNGYQSLHATVRLPALTLDVNSESESTAAAEQDNMEGAGLTGPSLEVQIRTRGQLLSPILHWQYACANSLTIPG